jgi:hypothetical protein
MFKTITLLKRRDGLSLDEFIAYYEDHHRRIGEKYLRGGAVRYVRRFLRPLDDIGDPTDYDVVTEIWFPDRASFEATLSALKRPQAAAEIAADEERLFDRSKIRMFKVEEHESAMDSAVGN